MRFTWPGLRDITYRLWRLRRLIAVCTALPLLVFGLMGQTGLSEIASDGRGLIITTAVLFFLVSAHAVIFPNSNQETVAISLLLAVFALVAPIISGSGLGWLIFVIFALWVLWSGQRRILSWQSSTRNHRPVFKARVRTGRPIEEARAWFPLRPGHVRGAYTCGEADAEGRFPVWYELGQANWMEALGITLPDLPGEPDEAAFADLAMRGDPAFYAKIEEDGPDYQRTRILEGEDEVASVVEHRFKARGNGCAVTESETAMSFPWGQSLFMWLADFQQDILCLHRDLLEGRQPVALREAHRHSLFTILTGLMFRKLLFRGMNPEALRGEVPYDEEEREESDPDKLAELLSRLGADFQSQGYTQGPMPLVTLEEFFEGNRDGSSFQGGPLSAAHRGLMKLREHEDIADIRMGITQWEGPSTWPLAEYIYLVTSADPADVGSWLKSSGIWVDELATSGEHRPREELTVPPGHQVVWAWID
ncbi:MAG: hypothetical protein HUJ27_00630 [Rhodobacteraceae bacterium]|nr:hypothetical protein [Paracoccaceae bacterium]